MKKVTFYEIVKVIEFDEDYQIKIFNIHLKNYDGNFIKQFLRCNICESCFATYEFGFYECERCCETVCVNCLVIETVCMNCY
jgi:hypothetical protein